jgi:hypothetical protein
MCCKKMIKRLLEKMNRREIEVIVPNILIRDSNLGFN